MSKRGKSQKLSLSREGQGSFTLADAGAARLLRSGFRPGLGAPRAPLSSRSTAGPAASTHRAGQEREPVTTKSGGGRWLPAKPNNGRFFSSGEKGSSHFSFTKTTSACEDVGASACDHRRGCRPVPSSTPARSREIAAPSDAVIDTAESVSRTFKK